MPCMGTNPCASLIPSLGDGGDILLGCLAAETNPAMPPVQRRQVCPVLPREPQTAWDPSRLSPAKALSLT